MGMTYDQYWYGDPQMVRAFYETHKLKKQRENETAWLHGLYVFHAVSIALANAFREKGKSAENYPAKPFGFDEEQKQLDEETELALAESYMKQMVRAGKNWGKNKVVI